MHVKICQVLQLEQDLYISLRNFSIAMCHSVESHQTNDQAWTRGEKLDTNLIEGRETKWVTLSSPQKQAEAFPFLQSKTVIQKENKTNSQKCNKYASNKLTQQRR